MRHAGSPRTFRTADSDGTRTDAPRVRLRVQRDHTGVAGAWVSWGPSHECEADWLTGHIMTQMSGELQERRSADGNGPRP